MIRLLLVVVLMVAGCAAEVVPMKLTSPAFADNGSIPSVYTCDGDDAVPPLMVSDVPPGAKSLALVMDDPDAVKPAGKVWDHWIVWNIAPTATRIDDKSGVHGKGTSGNLNYKGPCPPDREHRYYFKLYALDVMLDLPEGSTKKQVEEAVKGHVIASATLVGRYTRYRS